MNQVIGEAVVLLEIMFGHDSFSAVVLKERI